MSRKRSSQLPVPESWRELLADYDTEHAANERSEVRWFSHQPSLVKVIHMAACALDQSGRRFNHQRRIRKNAIKAAAQILLANETNIGRISEFHSLLELLEHLLLSVAGIGELYCYDCAVRIGAFLGVGPDRVYLHAGTRNGARALGLSYRRRWVFVSELPEPLQVRTPRELENILCIYADGFRNAVCRSRPSRC